MRTCFISVAALFLVVTVGGCSDSDSDSKTAEANGLSLVAIGDSIPYNSSNDCPGCTGFVDRYAEALADATGKEVTTSNLSQHNSLTLEMLMDELQSFKDELSDADAIIVGIAHNSNMLNTDAPCGIWFDKQTNTFDDWHMITPKCSKAWAEKYRPQYDELFATIASWRDGRPTVLRTIDKYSDWLGWEDAHLTPDQEKRTVFVHDDWNKMICESADAHGFECADIYHDFNGKDGTKPSGDLLAQDYTHPSDSGNESIARVLIDQGFEPLT
jgi:lysophospholipase L1-like esterase